MVVENIYVLFGDDEQVKQRHINTLKSTHRAEGCSDSDCEVVHADEKSLTPAFLDEILSYRPSFSKKRIVIIRRLHLLKKDSREVLRKHLTHPLASVIFVLDAAGMKKDDSLFKEVSASAKILYSKEEKELDTFDLCRALLARNTSAAVRIVNTLLRNRKKAHYILGGLIWQWEQTRDQLSPEQFKKGLQLLLYTDMKIKTGKLKEDLALEMLIIRLTALI